MGSLVIQDVFEPYYAGCRSARPEKPQAEAKLRPTLREQQSALERLRARRAVAEAEKPREG